MYQRQIKFNETYLLKGDGAEKAHNVNAHDAGLDGVTLTDKGDTVDVTLKTLNAGDKVSIAGKNYTIGATAADAQKIVDAQKVDGKTVTVNGTTYIHTRLTNGQTLMALLLLLVVVLLEVLQLKAAMLFLMVQRH